MSSTTTANNVQSIPSGNEPLNKAPTMKTPSDKTRSAVEAGAADAAKTGTISSGNQPLAPMVSPHSNTTRAAKRQEGAAAVGSGNLATGNEPIVGSPNEQAHSQMKSDKAMKKSDMSKKTMSDKKMHKGTNQAKNMAGDADAVKSGNEPLAPRATTTSTKSRASVKADAVSAAKNDAIKTGDGAAKAAN